MKKRVNVEAGNQKNKPLSKRRNKDSIVENAFAGYSVPFSGILKSNKFGPESQMTPLEKLELSSKGISKKELEVLKSRTALDYDKLAHLLSVTRATLINKQGNEKFSNTLSERILSLADIYSYGYMVFENEHNFNEWMFKPNKALGGKTPYDVCYSQFGKEEVKNIIGRIEHGVYS